MDKQFLGQEQIEIISKMADEKLFVIFGRNKDKNLTKLIPEADQMHKWSAICRNCGVDANFSVNGESYCRECSRMGGNHRNESG